MINKNFNYVKNVMITLKLIFFLYIKKFPKKYWINFI